MYVNAAVFRPGEHRWSKNLAVGDDDEQIKVQSLEIIGRQPPRLQAGDRGGLCRDLDRARDELFTALARSIGLRNDGNDIVTAVNDCLQVSCGEFRRTGKCDFHNENSVEVSAWNGVRLFVSGASAVSFGSAGVSCLKGSRQTACPPGDPFHAEYRPPGDRWPLA